MLGTARHLADDDARKAVFTLQPYEIVFKDGKARDHQPWPIGDEIAPIGALGRIKWRFHQFEIFAVIGIGADEKCLTMMFDIISTALPQITSGRVRAIAVSSPTRNRSLPDVPTLIESGVPEFDVGGWMAIYGPPALPDAAAQRITEATQRVLAQPEVRNRLEELGFTLWTGDGATLSKRATAERAMWATVTKGIEID